jgi:iron complex outermembrane receptor protein
LQGAFDVGGPVEGTDGTFLYRLTGLARHADTQVDEMRDRREFIAPALTWRPNADTSLTFLSYFQRDDSGVQQFLPSQGTLRPNPFGHIPRSFFSGEKDANNFDREQWGIGYQFEHRVNDAWTLRQNLRYSRIDLDMYVVRGVGLQPDLRTLNRAAIWIHDHTDAFTVDNQAETRFSTGPVQHRVLMGLDYRRDASDFGFARGSASPLDIFNPVYGRPFNMPTGFTGPDTRTNTLTVQNQLGLYVQDQLRYDRWLLTLSGRYDWVDTSVRNRLEPSHPKESDSAFSGRVGLNYLFDSGVSPYVAYSQSFQPLVRATATGQPFKPTRGEQVEAGIKYQPPGSNSFVSLAAYHLVQENVPTADPTDPDGIRQIQAGEVRVRGIEVEALAELTRELSLIASYGYTDSEVTQSNIAGQQGKRVALVPEHQAALWADYSWHEGPLKGLSLGGGLRYLTGAYGDTTESFAIPTHTLYDAAIRYDLGELSPTLKGFRVAVNGSNLGDKEVATCIAATECYYGPRRTVLGTLSYRW